MYKIKLFPILLTILLGAAASGFTTGPRVAKTINLSNGPAVNHPGPIAVDTETGNIFIASYDSGNIVKYDPINKSHKGEIMGFLYPECIQISGDSLYVASFNELWNPVISIFSKETLYPANTISSQYGYIYSMRVSEENKILYYGTIRNLYKVNLEDNTQELLLDLTTAGLGYNIVASCINIDNERNKLYITCAYWKTDGTLNGAVINFNLDNNEVLSVIDIGKNPAGFDHRYDSDFTGNRLFVTQMYSSEITVVNLASSCVQTSIPNVSWPQKLALDRTANRLYVVDNYSDKFHIIDTETLVLLKSLCPGDDPSGVCIDDKRGRVYTANHWSQDVGVISSADQNLIERLPFMPFTPLDIQVAEGKLYVTNGPNGGIFILDGQSGVLTDRILPFSYAPYYDDLSVAAGILNIYTGKMEINGPLAYITDEFNQSMAIFDIERKKFVNHTALNLFPSGIAKSDGKIYYPYISSGTLRLSVTDGNITESIFLGNSQGASEVAINGSTNKAYIADYANHQIVVVDISEKKLIKRIDAGYFPSGVAVNSINNIIYASNYGSDSVSVIDGSNDEMIGYIDVGKGPWGIETNGATGRVYVVNSTDGSLTVIDGNTNTVVATLQTGKNPKYCGIDPSKSLVYVPNQLDGNITVIEDIVEAPPVIPPGTEDDIEPAKAAIKVPTDGKKISGNAVTIMADILEGTVSGVLFQYQPINSTEWINIDEIDRKKPYSIYWNVSAIQNGDYRLRAVAYNENESPDPQSVFITVTVDDVNPDIVEDGNPDVNPNSPHRKSQKIDNQTATEVKLADGTKAFIPSGAISRNTSLVIETVKSAPIPAEGSSIKPLGVFRKYEFSDGTKIFSKPVQISLPYRDENEDGIIDGTAVKSENVFVMYFDEEQNRWTELGDRGEKSLASVSGSGSELTGKISFPGCVSVDTDHFTLFGLFYYSPTDNLDNIIVYPNPCKVFNGQNAISFDGLTLNSRISIYTLSGRFVNFIDASLGSSADWDLTSENGESVSSGIYLYRITDEKGNKKTGKLAVIR